MAQWPATLAQCPMIGWQEGFAPNVIEFNPDVGYPRRRRRSTARTYELAVVYKMSKAELATLWAFVENDIVDGALLFDWPNPRLNGALSPAMLATMPTVSQNTNDFYQVSFNVTVVG